MRNTKRPGTKEIQMFEGLKFETPSTGLCRSRQHTVVVFRFLNFDIISDLGASDFGFFTSQINLEKHAD
jgi:hypothetical protein